MRATAALALILGSVPGWAQGGGDTDLPSYDFAAISFVAVEEVGAAPTQDGNSALVSLGFGDAVALQLGLIRLESDRFDGGGGPMTVENDLFSASFLYRISTIDHSEAFVRLGGAAYGAGVGVGTTDASETDNSVVAGLGWRSRPHRRVSYDLEIRHQRPFSRQSIDLQVGVQAYLTPALGLTLGYQFNLDSEAKDECEDAGGTDCDVPDVLAAGLFFDFGGGKAMTFEPAD